MNNRFYSAVVISAGRYARSILRVVLAAGLLSAASGLAAPAPFGYWNFDLANREQLIYGSGTLTKTGTGSTTTGPNGATDGAVQMSGSGGWYTCTHNMPANGGSGSYRRYYTLMWDMKYPNTGTWKCLLQTNQGNGNDGDLFIRNSNGTIGGSAGLGGYSSSATAAGTWYRIVMTCDTTLGSGDVKIYVNGSLWYTSTASISSDGTYALDPTFLISQDDGTEDDTLVMSAFATWNTTLSAADVASLGSPSTVLVKNNQTITFGSLANKTYGDAAFGLSASASSGLGATFSVVSGPATINGSTLTLTGAGTVTVRASQAGDANWNAATVVDRSFAVNPKGVTITGVTASNKVYDRTATASLSGGSLSGVLGGDTVTITAGSGAFAGATVGTHAVSASGYGLGGAQAGNYTLASQPTGMTGTITAKAYTVNVDAQVKTYGEEDPALTYAVSGLVDGDTLTGTLTRDVGEDAGAYPILPGTLDAGANYTLVFNGADLTIGKATLVCRAADATRARGQPNPAFVVQYTGFVNGEDATVLDQAPTAATTATTEAPAGMYPITVHGGQDDNYAFSSEQGTLQVYGRGTLIRVD